MGEPLTLDEYMLEAERADDTYGQAVHNAAEQRANYELTYYKALANCPKNITSVAARKEYADAEAAREHGVWLMMEATEKAAKTHVQVLLGLMVASQSRMKNAGKQDGGVW